MNPSITVPEGLLLNAEFRLLPILKPNMGASVKILNHSNNKTIVVPVNIVQSDEKGKYVLRYGSRKNGKMTTHKKDRYGLENCIGMKLKFFPGLTVVIKLIIQGYTKTCMKVRQ